MFDSCWRFNINIGTPIDNGINDWGFSGTDDSLGSEVWGNFGSVIGGNSSAASDWAVEAVVVAEEQEQTRHGAVLTDDGVDSGHSDCPR